MAASSVLAEANVQKNDMSEFRVEDLDFAAACLDEIALEGLDGITIASFWKRLEKRPKFPIAVDDKSKRFLWRQCIAKKPQISFFKLVEPRPKLVVFDRYEHLDMETGLIIEPNVVPADIYPIESIQTDDARGSCSTFHTRINITNQIRGEGVITPTLDEVVSTWNEESLVMVASQEARRVALVGPECDPCLEFTQKQYLLLERIGRSRYEGEVTQGRASLSVLGEAPKNLYYLRKELLATNIITKQAHYQRCFNGQTMCCSLLHLTRFYVERKPRFLVLLQLLAKILSERPNKRASIESLRNALGLKEGSFRKVFNKYLYQITTVVMVPLSEVDPELPKERRFHGNGRVKLVKALQLLDNVDVTKIGKEDEDDEDDDDEVKDVAVAPIEQKWVRYFDRPLLPQILEQLETFGPEGAGLREMRSRTGLSRLEMRLLMENLLRLKAVTAVMKDSGRQRSNWFISKRLESQSQVRKKLKEESLKILEMTKGDAVRDEVGIGETSGGLENSKPLETEASTSVAVEEVEVKIIEVGPDVEEEDTQISGSPKVKKVSLDIIKCIEKWNSKPEFDLNESPVTYRMLKRVSLILRFVRQERLFEDIQKLKRMIAVEEAKEGYTEEIDRVSLTRLLRQLAKGGYIRSYLITFRYESKFKKLHFVAEKSMSLTNPIVRSAIELAKMKYLFAPSTVDGRKKSSSNVEKENINSLKALNAKEHKKTEKEELVGVPKYKYLYAANQHHGLECKFVRMKILHEFYFHLLYDYTGDASSECFTIWEEAKSESGEGDTAELTNRVPKVYRNEVSWRRYVPPLPIHPDWSSGWCLISDVILRLPLSIFLKLITCPYKIEGLDYYLKHPIRQHYLINHLPPEIRSPLLIGRRYIFSFAANNDHLARMGLLSYGPQQSKEKDQRFIYIHTKASLVDTRSTKPSYFQTSAEEPFPQKTFLLKNARDVQQYWFDVRDICMQTPLGCVGSCRGQSVLIERIDAKKELMDCLRMKKVEEVVDNGDIPGDGKGAGGFDSLLFAHLQRNWYNINTAIAEADTSKEDIDKEDTGAITPGLHYMKYLQQQRSNSFNSRRRLNSLAKNKKLQLVKSNEKAGNGNTTERVLKTSIQVNQPVGKRMKGRKRKRETTKEDKPAKRTRGIRRKHTRIIPEKKAWRQRRPYYDDKDKAALKLQSKLRVDWSPTEDSFLLLCKVASNLLAPNHFYQLVVPTQYVRDLIHEIIPSSMNKTSRACQRRIIYMMKNPQTKYNVAVFVGEAQQDEELMSHVQRPNVPKTDEAAWCAAFRKIAIPVIEKFKSPKGCKTGVEDLPDSIEEFNRRYILVSSDKFLVQNLPELEVKNVVDVRFSVLYTLVLSSLCGSKDKKDKWSYHLYQLYQRYSDRMLRSVFTRLRKERLIVVEKQSRMHANNRPKKVVDSAIPYRLSITYENKFLTKYQRAIFPEAHTLLSEMLAVGRSGNAGGGVPLIVQHEGGFVSAVASLFANNRILFDLQIPDQIIVFETTNDSKKSDPNSSPLSEEPRQSKSNQQFISAKASRVSLYMLRQELYENPADKVQHSQDYIVVNSCSVKCSLTGVLEEEVTEETPHPGDVGTPAPNRDHDYMTGVEDPSRTDFFVRKSWVQRICRAQEEIPRSNGFARVAEELINQKKYEKTEDLERVYEFVSRNRELGATLKVLSIEFPVLWESGDLMRCLEDLVGNGLVIKVGTNVRIFVAVTACNMWTLPKVSLDKKEDWVKGRTEFLESEMKQLGERETPTEESCMTSSEFESRNLKRKSSGLDLEPEESMDYPKFLPRPWKNVDGTLNVESFGSLLQSILCHIMEHPGITFQKLMGKFLPALQAVYILELVEILEEMKCVSRIYFKEKVSLFSDSNNACEIMENNRSNPFEDTMVLEAKSDCVLTLANFLSILNE